MVHRGSGDPRSNDLALHLSVIFQGFFNPYCQIDSELGHSVARRICIREKRPEIPRELTRKIFDQESCGHARP
jgi:hypothetical protein